jgi:monoamine oxidase
MIRELIKVAYTIEYGRDAEEQSCLNLLYLIGTEPGEFSIFGTSDERFYIDGGNDQVPRLLAQLLADSIQTGTVLESLKSLSDKRYRVSLRSGEKTFERNYERVLLTVPFSVLRKIQLDVDLPVVKRLSNLCKALVLVARIAGNIFDVIALLINSPTLKDGSPFRS